MRVRITGKQKAIGEKPHLWFLPALLLLALASPSVQVSAQRMNQSCKGRIPVKVNKKVLEAEVWKLRKKESNELPGLFLCREALSTLKKYALDPDPRVREQIARYLDNHYSTEALQTLVRLVEAYPSDPSAFPVFYTANYPCYFFRKIKFRSLTEVLAARIKSGDDSVNVEEIYLLGCLAPNDPQARKLLEEMNQPSFTLRLSEQDAQGFSKRVTYALAEAGVKEAEEKVLADTEALAKSSDLENISDTVMSKLKQFTNCRILQRYAQFITDKRPGKTVKISYDLYDPKYNLESNLKLLRIGDSVIAKFASIYGAKATGTGERDSLQSKAYTDEEMERIYQRVKKTLQGGKFSTCGSSK